MEFVYLIHLKMEGIRKSLISPHNNLNAQDEISLENYYERVKRCKKEFKKIADNYLLWIVVNNLEWISGNNGKIEDKMGVGSVSSYE